MDNLDTSGANVDTSLTKRTTLTPNHDTSIGNHDTSTVNHDTFNKLPKGLKKVELEKVELEKCKGEYFAIAQRAEKTERNFLIQTFDIKSNLLSTISFSLHLQIPKNGTIGLF